VWIRSSRIIGFCRYRWVEMQGRGGTGAGVVDHLGNRALAVYWGGKLVRYASSDHQSNFSSVLRGMSLQVDYNADHSPPMKRAWLVAPARKLTKTHCLVTESAPSNASGSGSLLGVPNVRRVSNIAGNGPPVSLALAIGVGLPIALWTYKVGMSAILCVREDDN